MIRPLRHSIPILATALAFALPALAQDAVPDAAAAEAGAGDPAIAINAPKPAATTLDELLEEVRTGWAAERAENQRREAEFKRRRNEQAQLLKDAEAELARQEALSERLETSFGEKEIELAQLEETLTEKLGTLGELFGVVRQVAGDTRSQIDASIVSAQLPGRSDFLLELGKKKELPSIAALEKLWATLHEEMTESGKVVRFRAKVYGIDGTERERDVVRAGTFNAISEGKYLAWDSENGKLEELGRQPDARHLGPVADFEAAETGLATLSIDPSRGTILSLLIETPSFIEQLEYGGVVGYAIIILGAIAALIAIVRWAVLFVTTRKVNAQQGRDKADMGNPLGRVLSVYEENRQADAETLELKLDEVILRETASLERFLWLIKVVSVVAPLMGLLGTVTGMIRTFQAITLFGTGDPKLMASGISEALVTTMLGLMVAIPLVLLHAFVVSSSKRVVDVLEEQSAGLVASRAEEA